MPAYKMDARFTRMMGIEYLIAGAPMFLVSYGELPVTVSKAGGLGTFPVANYHTIEDMGNGLQNIRRQTDP